MQIFQLKRLRAEQLLLTKTLEQQGTEKEHLETTVLKLTAQQNRKDEPRKRMLAQAQSELLQLRQHYTVTVRALEQRTEAMRVSFAESEKQTYARAHARLAATVHYQRTILQFCGAALHAGDLPEFLRLTIATAHHLFGITYDGAAADSLVKIPAPLVGAGKVALYLVSNPGHLVSIDDTGEVLARFSLRHGVCGQVAASGTPVNTATPYTHPNFNTKYDLQSCLMGVSFVGEKGTSASTTAVDNIRMLCVPIVRIEPRTTGSSTPLGALGAAGCGSDQDEIDETPPGNRILGVLQIMQYRSHSEYTPEEVYNLSCL
jgi:hypothetical protein